MIGRKLLFSLILIVFLVGIVHAQHTPWAYWTLLPDGQMKEIIGEASGETAWNTIMETGGYNKDRLPEEFKDTFYETKYIYEQLKLYGLPGTEIVRFPGAEVWDGIKGELWEVEPLRQKIASYQDMRAMLINGSNSADIKAELVWVGRGTREEIDQVEVEGKIVVTEGSVGSVHSYACMEKGAEGVIAISTSRPYFDPLQIPWGRLGSRRRGPATAGDAPPPKPKFGFYLPVREGDFLKQRLLRREKITVHAQVETTTQPYELQNITCKIPGTDPNADEIIFSAHLFEGYVKQGANDNKSGSAGILECARVLHTLIEEGRLPRPKRTIRFLWGPEFSGTGPWVKANKDIMEKTLCNINMDMVGEWLVKNKAFFCLMRTTYGHAHYINDVMENYYRFVGEGSRERIQNRGGFYKVPHRVVAPSGADEPFYYSIETHYGASDHEVFNDWGVQVPGIMMIAWPDQWYHTSGDRVDKSDPTQMKRVAVIGAAAAYTIANANDDMAIKIAGETTSNGTRRLGHQLVVAMEKLNKTTSETFTDSYKMAKGYLEASLDNELATLASIKELAKDKKYVGDYVAKMQKSIQQIASSHLASLETHMKVVAKQLNTQPVKIKLTDEEKKAAKIIPRQTSKVTSNGYRGYTDFFPEDQRGRRFRPQGIATTYELHLLINGKRSVLDIKKALDAQYQRESTIKGIMDYLEVLKTAGLVEM